MLRRSQGEFMNALIISFMSLLIITFADQLQIAADPILIQAV